MSDKEIEKGESQDGVKNTRITKIILGVLAGLLIVGAGWFLIADPINVIARLRGLGSDPFTTLVPADTPIYIRIDNLELLSNEASDLFSAFDTITSDASEEETGFLENLDDSLQEEYGFNYSEDIRPWVGQYTAISVQNIEYDQSGEIEDIEFVFYLESLNKNDTEAFLEKYLEKYSEIRGQEYAELKHRGNTIYVFEGGNYQDSLAVVIYKNILMFGDSAESLIGSMGLKFNQSLASDAKNKELYDHIPASNILIALVDFESYMKMFAEMFGNAGISLDVSTALMGASYKSAVTVSIEEYGIKMDSYSLFDEENVSSEVRDILEVQYSNAENRTLDKFPEETFLYVRGYGLNQSIKGMETSDSPEMQDFMESMKLMKEETGVDVLKFLGTMDGEYAVGLARTNGGLLYTFANLPLGLQMVMETSQEETMLEFFDGFNTLASADGSVSLDEQEIAGLTVYSLEAAGGLQSGSLLSYGVGNGWGIISTDINMVSNGFEGEVSLADSKTYQDVWKELPKDLIPVMFVDIKGFIDVLRDFMLVSGAPGLEDFETSVALFEPISALAGGNRQLDENMYSSTFVLFVDIDSNQ